jgi:mannitol/fructose-specific phosphotransferase system IIA component (Ntr-type)
LAAIVRDLDERGLVSDRNLAAGDLAARERVMSTGVGNGVAIPHAYTDAVARVVAAVYRTRDGVEFGAPDGAAVDLFFVVLGPRSARREHMRVLTRLSRLLNHADFRAQLRTAPDPETVRGVFRRFGER